MLRRGGPRKRAYSGFAWDAKQIARLQGHTMPFVRLVNQYPNCFKLSQTREYQSQTLASAGGPLTEIGAQPF